MEQRREDNTEGSPQEVQIEGNQKIIKILEDPNRNPEDASYLYQHLKHFHFFERFTIDDDENLSSQALVDFCKTLICEKYQPGDIILKENDNSNNKVFIMYQGEALVIAKALETQEPETKIELTLESDKKASTHSEEEKPDSSLLKENLGTPIASDEEEIVITSHADKRFKTAILTNVLPHVKPPNIKKRKKVLPPGKTTRLTTIKTKYSNPHELDSPLTGNLDGDLARRIQEYGKVKEKIKQGGYFGEDPLTSEEQPEAIVMAKTPCIVLTAKKEDLLVLKKKCDRQRIRLLGFLLEIFPDLKKIKDQNVRESYSHLVEVKRFSYNNIILYEGQRTDCFCILYEGTCQLYRNIWVDKSQKLPDSLAHLRDHFNFAPASVKQIHICEISSGMIFGEEVLFNESQCNEYCVRVTSSSAKVILVNKNIFKVRFPKNIVLDVFEMYKMKRENFAQLVLGEIQKKGIVLDNEDINEPLMGHIEVPREITTKKENTLENYSSFELKKFTKEAEEFKKEKPKEIVAKPMKLIKRRVALFSRRDFIVPQEQAKPKVTLPYLNKNHDTGSFVNAIRSENKDGIARRWDNFFESLKSQPRVYKLDLSDKASKKISDLKFFQKAEKDKQASMISPTADKSLSKGSIFQSKNSSFMNSIISSRKEIDTETSLDSILHRLSPRPPEERVTPLNIDQSQLSLKLKSLLPKTNTTQNVLLGKEIDVKKLIDEEILFKNKTHIRPRIVPPLKKSPKVLKKRIAVQSLDFSLGLRRF
jgi:Cyclic nucleotide-binding domain.